MFSGRTCIATLIAWAGCVVLVIAAFSNSAYKQVLDADFWPPAVDAIVTHDESAREEYAEDIADAILDQEGVTGADRVAAEAQLEPAIAAVIASDEVRDATQAAVAQAHRQLMARIDDPSTRDRPIAVDLSAVLPPVAAAAGMPQLSGVDSLTFEVMTADEAADFAQVMENAEEGTSWILWVGLGLCAVALVVASDRLKLLTRLGFGLVLGGIVTAFAWGAASSAATAGIVDDAAKEAARDVLDQGFADLSDRGWQMIGIGVLLIVASIGLRVFQHRREQNAEPSLTPAPAAVSARPAAPAAAAPTRRGAAPPTDLAQASKDIFGE